MPEEIKNEITNVVLATKMDGFKELVDTKFNNVQGALDRIEKTNSNFVTKNELEEVKKEFTGSVKRIEDAFIKHNEDDKESFGGLSQGQQQARDFMVKWGTIAGLVLFVLPFLAPIILSRFGF